MENRIGAGRWTMDAIPPCIDRLKFEVKRFLFLPYPLPSFLVFDTDSGSGSGSATGSTVLKNEPTIYLSNREYGILCEIRGESYLALEACNCGAPDTGNMEGTYKLRADNDDDIHNDDHDDNDNDDIHYMCKR
jgi:hypothetical protein